MSDIIEKHTLSSGDRVWIQRTKVPGVRKPIYSVVQCSMELGEPPVIQQVPNKGKAFEALADILKRDVLEIE